MGKFTGSRGIYRLFFPVATNTTTHAIDRLSSVNTHNIVTHRFFVHVLIVYRFPIYLYTMDDTVDEQMTLDDFSRWRVKELKNYLADRAIPRSNKTNEELVALAYSAYVARAPVVQTELEEKKQRAEEYRQLLKVDGEYLPDPLVDLDESGWQGESTGLLNWPPISYFEIPNNVFIHLQH